MSFNLLYENEKEPIIQEIKIGIATHSNGSKEYLINMNDMDFVAEFLNGLAERYKTALIKDKDL